MNQNIKEKTVGIIEKVLNRVVDKEAIEKGIFYENVGITSVELVEIVVEIEKEFSIEIEDRYLSIELLKSIEYLCDFIEDKMA